MSSNINSSDQNRRSFIETARRAQIIDCAARTIAELGYGQASLAQIAQRAGISAGVISYYFEGKDDLIRAVAAHVYETGEAFIRPRVSGRPDAPAMLAAFISANVDFAAAHPALVIAMVEINVFARANRSAAAFDLGVAQVRHGALARILESGQASGAFRPFSIAIMTETILEAIDLGVRRPDWSPDLLASELVGLFERATRADGASAAGGDR